MPDSFVSPEVHDNHVCFVNGTDIQTSLRKHHFAETEADWPMNAVASLMSSAVAG